MKHLSLATLSNMAPKTGKIPDLSTASCYTTTLHGDYYICANSDDDYDESSIYIGDIGNVYTDSGLRSVYRR
ncbi:hypothetical protein CGMCC3_g11791 [Colletotrichum fructicola]|nr:uncharacterized protein CGMCC3_g11791 [Colletotrichum fructicola]KAE9572078.1 hypothetical protein CGMCC3_g11791 [Colletotrichum fructicola]